MIFSFVLQLQFLRGDMYANMVEKAFDFIDSDYDMVNSMCSFLFENLCLKLLQLVLSVMVNFITQN